ncbi:MAG: PspC domain-containing protein [Oscillospiraceae bacterium]|nr:PspC domain-containing protein [Oscillospiraceae bacterium]
MKEKKIYKSRDRVICGVCGGLAEYLGIDPLWTRLAAAFLALTGGSGVILYFIAALLMEDAPDNL